jgi:hypothetical protein
MRAVRYPAEVVEGSHRTLAFSVMVREAESSGRPLLEVVQDTADLAIHAWLNGEPDDQVRGHGATCAVLAASLCEWEVVVEAERDAIEAELNHDQRRQWRAELSSVHDAISATMVTDA